METPFWPALIHLTIGVMSLGLLLENDNLVDDIILFTAAACNLTSVVYLSDNPLVELSIVQILLAYFALVNDTDWRLPVIAYGHLCAVSYTTLM